MSDHDHRDEHQPRAGAGAIGDKTVAENATLTITPPASDADGDTLTLHDRRAAGRRNVRRRHLQLDADHAQAGSYPGVTFSDGDGTPNLAASEAITITVTNTNRAPALAAIGDKTVAENATLTITPSATDADGDTLTLRPARCRPARRSSAASSAGRRPSPRRAAIRE